MRYGNVMYRYWHEQMVSSAGGAEWLFQTLIIAFILSAEALNTAIEKLSDLVEPKHNKTIGHIKDMGAAGVFIGVIAATVMAGVIYIPKIF